jgi:hypothetical protein
MNMAINSQDFEFLREHVRYEMDMLGQTFAALSHLNQYESISVYDRHTINCALIESFTIHFRALYDFFQLPGASKPKNDDLTAAYYIKYWDCIRPDCSDCLKNARIRVNKEVAHITKKRISGTPEEKAWPFVEIQNEMKTYFDKFLAELQKQLIIVQ